MPKSQLLHHSELIAESRCYLVGKTTDFYVLSPLEERELPVRYGRLENFNLQSLIPLLGRNATICPYRQMMDGTHTVVRLR